METRIFGRTGAKITFITMGGCGLGYVDQDEADKAVKLAIEHGINMIDVAPTYGNAEVCLNPWIEKHRNKFFLSEKTLKRKKKGALRQLNKSLEKLGTSYFDLYQFHAVSSLDELHQILGENGAMEAFLEAKETGVIKNIGITAHHDVRILQKALELSDDIDTILLPVYAASIAYPNPVNDRIHFRIDNISKSMLYYQILNLRGQSVLTGTISDGTKEGIIDVSDLNEGVYIINFQYYSGFISKKIILL